MADISKIKLPSGDEYNLKDYRIPGVDTTPTSGSDNIVTSGGVYDAIDDVDSRLTAVEGTEWVTTEDYSVIDSVVRDTYTKSEIDTMLSNIEGGGSESSGTGEENVIEAITFNGSSVPVTDKTAAITANIENFYFVTGSSSAAGNSTSGSYLSTKWEGTIPGVSTATNGLKIAYRIATNTGVSTAGVVLSIDGTNYYPVVIQKNTLVTTHYPVGSTVLMVFNSTQTASAYLTSNTKTTVTGCWQIMEYNSNTDTYQRLYPSTTDVEYPITTRYNTTSGSSYYAEYGRYTSDVTLNPSTGTISANAFKINNGTSSQFLKADGSTDSNTYALSSAIPTETTVTGWGFTKNEGTLTGVTFNGTAATVTDGVAAITANVSGGNGASGTLNTNTSTAQSVSSSESFDNNITLHKIAKTGTYTDLISRPVLKTNNTTAQSTSSSETITGTINLHKVAKTGTYSDLIGTPTIPTKVSDLTNDSNFVTSSTISGKVSKAGDTMNDDATLTFADSNDYYSLEIGPNIINLENSNNNYGVVANSTIPSLAVNDSTVTTSIRPGSIVNKDGSNNQYTLTIPMTTGTVALTSQIPAAPGTLKTDNANAQTASASEALSGTINLHKVAKTGTYSDLIGTPTIPTESTVSGWGFTKNSGTLTGVTFNGGSATVTNGVAAITASIPTVNNSTISIQKGGTAVDSFTTNASSAKTINIPNELPSYSSSDSGKILSVNSSGQLVWITPITVYSGAVTPSTSTSAANAIDGDIYIQLDYE